MARDRNQPLKLENTDTGGDDIDLTPTAMDRNEDYYDGRGVTFQSATSDDDSVVAERDADDNLVFEDLVAGRYTLTQLTSGGFDINSCIFDSNGWFVFDSADLVITRA